jgi:hypothetical protein
MADRPWGHGNGFVEQVEQRAQMVAPTRKGI